MGKGAPRGTDWPTHANLTPGEGDRWLRSVVENSSEIVSIVDPDGTLRYANPAWGRALGYDPDEAIGTMNVLDHVHPEDLAHVLEETEKALAEGGVTTNEAQYRFRRRDGSWLWMESVGTYLLDDPDVKGVVVHTRNVTERKEAEEELNALRRGHEELVGSVEAIIWKGEAKTLRFTFVSDHAEAILGYPAQRWTQEPSFWSDHIHPEDREWAVSFYRKAVEEKEDHDFEYRMIDAEGEVVWLRDIVRVGVEDGVPTQLFGVMVDITERKEAEEALKESEQHFRSTFEDAPIGVALVSLPSSSPGSDRRYLRVNPALCEMLGYSEEELLSMTSSDVTHPEDLEDGRARAERLVEEDGSKYTIEKRYVRSDGRVVWAMLNVSLVRDSEGNPSHFVSQYQDVTQRKETEEALRRSEERYRNVVEEQTELVCRFSPDLTLTFVNDAYCRYFGKGSEELVGSRFLDDVHEADHAYYEEQLMKLNPESPTSTIEERVFTPGGMRWLQWTDTAIFDVDGCTVEYQSVGRDVTERKEAEERLEHLAFHDPLTDLPNRHLFLDRLGRALERTRRRRGRKAAVLFMDLDGFKVVNDSLGHEVGDLLLTVVAQRLGRCLRPEDTLARFGGDEFVVLIEDIDDSVEAVQVAERITQELRRPFIMGGRELHVAASIGISLGDARTHDAEDLLREADTAMYRSKDEDRDYTVFDPTMYERALGRLELENDLRRAIEQEEFVVHYQPIVRLDDAGGGWRVEALVRWDHPERGLLDPDEFVPVAEESGLVVPMGEQVLREACRRAVEWNRQFPRSTPLVMCVNLSARQLSRPDLAETVERVLGETGLEGSRLTLDVTETVYVKALAASTTILDRLRGLGVEFSIDDFGTGYSSLSYLKRLPADAIKIDKSFVKGLGYDVEDTAVVRMIIELTHTLGREVVAEGVESAEQVALLKEMGCDMAQGFYFSKPLPPEEIPALLSSYIPTERHQGIV